VYGRPRLSYRGEVFEQHEPAETGPRHGEPRLTRHVDLAILTGLGGEGEFGDALLGHYGARLDGARDFALRHRVILVETAAGVPVDLSLAGLPFEARLMGRSTAFAIDASVSLITCSAEDLIVLKVFAGRVQDWLDVEGVIVRQGRDWIARWCCASFGHCSN
jgi:hypothetical protein